MKRIGQLLIASGFLEGALVSVLDEVDVPWLWLSLGLALGIVGVILINIAERRIAREVRESGAGISELDEALAGVVSVLNDLDESKESINAYDFRARIDAKIPALLSQFVESREAISHIYGLQAYADIMSHFAAAERYLNRVWSCSADGYIDEIYAYLPRSRAEFQEALSMLRALKPNA